MPAIKPPICPSTPRAAEQRIERVDDADVFIHERTDGGTKHITRNMADLARIENDFPPVNHEVWPDIGIWKAKFFGGKERDNNPPNRTTEPIGLNDDDKGNGLPVPAGIAVNT